MKWPNTEDRPAVGGRGRAEAAGLVLGALQIGYPRFRSK